LKGIKLGGVNAGKLGRDAAAVVVNGILNSSLREIGSIAGYWIAPAIAGTNEGKQFNRMLAVLLFADSLLERFSGGKGVV